MVNKTKKIIDHTMSPKLEGMDLGSLTNKFSSDVSAPPTTIDGKYIDTHQEQQKYYAFDPDRNTSHFHLNQLKQPYY